MQPEPDELFARLKTLFQRATMGISTYGDASEIDKTLEQASQSLNKARQRYQDSEQRIRTLAEAIPIGLLITTEDGSIEAYNKESLRLLDCTDADLFHHNITNFLSDETPLQLVNREPLTSDNPASRATNCDQSGEFIIKKPNNQTFHCELIIRSFNDDSGQHRLILFQDITARHELQQVKEEFVSMLSHDLRTPLTSVQAFFELLEEGMLERDALAEQARRMNANVARLIGIINTLLDVYKLEAGRLEMFLELIPASTLLESSVQALDALAAQRNITLNMVPCSDDILVKADSEYIIQVLINLISNAIKYSPEAESVDIKAEANNRSVRFSVVDRGPGIPQEFKSKLFNRFQQVDAATARAKGGTGLGLAFSKAIIEQHGGAIGVESEPGHGSTFWFSLPQFVLDQA